MDDFEKLFISPKNLPGLYPQCEVLLGDDNLRPDLSLRGVFQLFMLGSLYMYGLYIGSSYVVEGSELLLLIPKLAPVVGSLVLPVLSALPGAAIIAFSGNGSDLKNLERKISVGIGALAGSTAFLLTLPWAISIISGRVDIDWKRSSCNYKKRIELDSPAHQSFKKLDGKHEMLTETGVQPNIKIIRSSAKILALTSLPYLILQGATLSSANVAVLSNDERFYKLFALLATIIFFFTYLYFELKNASTDQVLQDIVDNRRTEALKEKTISITTAFFQILATHHMDDELDDHLHDEEGNASPDEAVVQRQEERFRAIVRKFFNGYDYDQDDKLDIHGLKLLLQDLGMPSSEADAQRFMIECDENHSGDVDFEEFFQQITKLITNEVVGNKPPSPGKEPKEGEERSLLVPKIPVAQGSSQPIANPEPLSRPAPNNGTHTLSAAALTSIPSSDGNSVTSQPATTTTYGSLPYSQTPRSPSMSALFRDHVRNSPMFPARKANSINPIQSMPKMDLDPSKPSPSLRPMQIPQLISQPTPQLAPRPVPPQPLPQLPPQPRVLQHTSSKQLPNRSPTSIMDEREEEEEEVPKDLAHLPPHIQQRRIILRSFRYVVIGLLLIIAFSDPFVDVLDEIGVLIGAKNGFYVGFILSPLASDGASIVASYRYSQKKTTNSITVSLATLLGSAIMNNTFELGIFIAIIYFRDINWTFTAETIV